MKKISFNHSGFIAGSLILAMAIGSPVQAQRMAHRPTPAAAARPAINHGGAVQNHNVSPGVRPGGAVEHPNVNPNVNHNTNVNHNVNVNTNVNRNVNVNTNVNVHGNNYVRPVVYNHNNVIVVHNYAGFRPYAYHPYHPYAWGPSWHPVGWFVATLAATAVTVAIIDAATKPEYPEYYYDQGVYYAKSDGGYTAVSPPAGATIKALPSGYNTVVANSKTYYYYGGVFYSGGSGSYKVVTAPAGAVVANLPQGAQETDANGSKLMEYQGTYYQPIMNNGEAAYEVVTINK